MKNTSFLLRFSACLTFLSMAAVAVAQTRSSAGGQAAGCAACGGLTFFLIAAVVLNIAILVWVARDAKARGMDSAILWMLLVFFTGFIGLIVYIFVRPQGNLIPCPNCNNKRLAASVRCPHCGFGAPA